MVVVTLLEDRQVNLAALGTQLQMGKLSFASPQRLMHYLGVIPGAVTPLAVIKIKTLRLLRYWIRLCLQKIRCTFILVTTA